MWISMLSELSLLLNCMRLIDINQRSICKETGNPNHEWMYIKAAQKLSD
jgi:hypothetical protein